MLTGTVNPAIFTQQPLGGKGLLGGLGARTRKAALGAYFTLPYFPDTGGGLLVPRASRDFSDNLRTPMPLSRKAYLVLRNNWIKIRTGSTCCGHPGEPGC